MELVEGALVTPALRLVHLLGRGGMGSVWVADHLALETRVAVKFIVAEGSEHDELRVRFEHEAKAAAQIKSPHAVQIFDRGLTDDGTPYIVMELLEGESLADLLARRGVLDLGTIALVARDAGKALAAAHRAGIVHRDVKPGNVFLARSSDDPADDPVVKVLDFGVAKRVAPAATAGATRTGALLGTPAYMSPEQMADPKAVGPASDAWSLAVLVYFALLGRLPFEGESVISLWKSVSSGSFERPRALRSELPAALDGWFERAFQVEPADRFPSIKQATDALCAIADGSGDTSRRPSRLAAEPIEADADTAAFVAGANLDVAVAEPPGETRPTLEPKSSSDPAPTVPIAAEPVRSEPLATSEPMATDVAEARPPRRGPMIVSTALVTLVVVAAVAVWALRLGPFATEPPTEGPSGSAVASPAEATTTAASAPTKKGTADPPAGSGSAATRERTLRARCANDQGCKTGMHAWCDEADERIACCASGLVALGRDGMCGCPPGGTDEPDAAKAGCRVADKPPNATAPSALQASMRAEWPKLRACFDEARQRHPQIAGTISLAFRITPDGDPFQARIEGTNVGDVVFQRCVLDILRAIEFPAPFGSGTTSVVYPIRFDDG